jgi:hypothetical protein
MASTVGLNIRHLEQLGTLHNSCKAKRRGRGLPCSWARALGLTDVCHLLTKQNIQVGLQIQYMLYNFQMVSLRINGAVKSFDHPTYGLQH